MSRARDKMDEENFSGKVLLQGFDDAETDFIRKIVDKYEKKLARLGYEEIRLTLQRHRKGGNTGKSFVNEITGLVKLKQSMINAEITSHSFYPAITRVMEKLVQEAEHKLQLEQKHRGRIGHIIDQTGAFKGLK